MDRRSLLYGIVIGLLAAYVLYPVIGLTPSTTPNKEQVAKKQVAKGQEAKAPVAKAPTAKGQEVKASVTKEEAKLLRTILDLKQELEKQKAKEHMAKSQKAKRRAGIPIIRRPAPDWLIVDLGEETVIEWLRAKPRIGFPQHFWRKAVLEGSNDGTTFEPIANLSVPHLPASDDKWLDWYLEEPDSYRYYKLSIYRGYDEGHFYSFAELEMGNSEENQILDDFSAFASSPYLELHPPTALIDTDPETFWHVK